MTSIPIVRPLLVAGVLAALVLGVSEYLRPSVLLVGNVTVDIVDKKPALGGAAAYAAAVLSAFGVRACIVTAAAEDADLSAFKGHDLNLVNSNATLTFEHTYTWWGNKRKLKVLAQPNDTLAWRHVPAQCRRARTILLGPLTPQDMDCASFVNQPRGWADRWFGFQQHIGFMAQGLQRDLDSTGKVIPKKEPSPLLTGALGPRVYVFLSDVETDVWADGMVANLTLQSARWLVTRGESGADEYTHGAMQHLPPHKVDAVADTNGAGDTFATAYMLALASRWPSPGSFANWAASRAVMMPQACKPHCVQQGLHANSTFAQLSKWVASQLQMAEVEGYEMLEAAHGGLSQLWNTTPGRATHRLAQTLMRQLRRQRAPAPTA